MTAISIEREYSGDHCLGYVVIVNGKPVKRCWFSTDDSDLRAHKLKCHDEFIDMKLAQERRRLGL